MTTAVRAMVSKCLGALIYQNTELATQVLESDEIVDQHGDQVFETLLAGMTDDPAQAAPNLQFVLASRSLERMADHTTNIAEDVLFWVRGLEVRHGRAKQLEQNAETAIGCKSRRFSSRRVGSSAEPANSCWQSSSFSHSGHRLFNRHAYSGHAGSNALTVLPAP